MKYTYIFYFEKGVSKLFLYNTLGMERVHKEQGKFHAYISSDELAEKVAFLTDCGHTFRIEKVQ